MTGAPGPAALTPEERARGRRLAILSHPAGMTHRVAFTDQLPTLALVALGANETLIGLQRSFASLGQLLQLPTLRTLGRFTKRQVLVGGQVIAVAGSVPLLLFGWIEALPHGTALAIALLSFAVASAGIVVAQTVWFPMLHAYQEPGRVGRFFATLRSGWTLTLILYFLGSQRWLALHPGDFGPLFAVGLAAGIVRALVVLRLPEPEGEPQQRVRVRDGFALVRRTPALRRYLVGVIAAGAMRKTVVPFTLVMLRRVIGLSDAEVLLTTVASFAGSLAGLYPFGRAVDRFGPAPVFAVTAAGGGLLFASLLGVSGPQPGLLWLLVAFFFGVEFLAAGFDLADTRVLFGLAPQDAPERVIVVGQVLAYAGLGAAPLLAGALLDRALGSGVAPLTAYHTLFGVAAVVHALAFVPLRRFIR